MKHVIYELGNQKLWIDEHWANGAPIQSFIDRIPWRQNSITVFGKTHFEPRLTAWFGPGYQYANVKWPETSWPDFMLEWRERIQLECPIPLNAVLCNYYRTGRDAMGWHSDNEAEIDQRCVASLSLGATRTFKIKHRTLDLHFNIELQDGCLLVMENLQQDWVHAVPRRLRVSEPRINFTFRHIRSENAF